MLTHDTQKCKAENLRSTCFISWNDKALGKNPIFKHVFIAVGVAIASFKQHCRPLNRIDTCHLKGMYKGVLMIAIGLDGNNRIDAY